MRAVEWVRLPLGAWPFGVVELTLAVVALRAVAGRGTPDGLVRPP